MKNKRKWRIAAIITLIGAFAALSLTGCGGGGTPGGSTLVSIAVTRPPTKTQYNLGEDLDTTGMVVTATYSDDTTEPVTGYKTSGYDKNTRGNQTITVSYGGKTARFTVNVIDPNLPAVATPTASPGAGTYSTAQSVTLTTETGGAKIYYTTDGTEPTEASREYSSAISIGVTTTLKAFAVKDGMNDSDVLTAEYILTFAAAPALTLEPDNAKITYTWTASDPAADSYDVYWKAGSDLSAVEVKTGTKITGAASGGTITGLANGTAYSVIVTANKAGFSGVDSAVQTTTPASVYTITGSGTAFTATRAGATIGEANQPIQTVIDAIRTHANGDDCIISFGDGDVLDIGTASVSFNNTGGTWGLVTLTGKITSAEDDGTSGTIAIADSVSVTSMADIAKTRSFSTYYAIYHNSTGILTISGGTILTEGVFNGGPPGMAVYNASTGTVTISGGTVSSGNITGVVYNASTGTITISGGTVSATTGSAIYNDSGDVTISGGMVSSGAYTVYNRYGNVTISGGTVSATRVNNDGAVYNSTGTVNISGGTVESAGTGINNGTTGTVNISGGTVLATTRAVYNASTGKITVSGTAKVTSSSSDPTIYLYDNVSTATAVRLEISGGTVENTGSGNAVSNSSDGSVTISGGTVQAATGRAVSSYSADGKITVSGTALVTSAASGNTASGTVYIAIRGSATTARLEIQGGTVENTSASTTGNAVYNASTGAVTISGGTVSATTGSAIYNNSTGTISISGAATKITSANVTADQGTIYLASSGGSTTVRLSIQNSTVENTAINGNAIYNASTGAVTISNGIVGDVYKYSTGAVTISNSTVGRVFIYSGGLTISSGNTVGRVYNYSTGTITISGGTVGGVTNDSTGTINISGGTVSVETGVAVSNASTGKITVSGATTLITSANTNAAQGTIYLADSGTDTAVRLEIQGGTVENTSARGNTIRNDSTGTVTISGGTVQAATGYAVYNYSTGKITVSGTTTLITSANTNAAQGTIYLASGTSGTAVRLEITGGTVENTSATTGNAVYNDSTGAVTMSGGTVSVTGTSARAIYKNTSGALTISDGTVSATGASGYSVYNATGGTVTITEPPAVIVGSRYP